MIKTSLCEILKIKHPILQGGMAHLATGKLAAAVSQAGGLGIIGAGNAPAEWVAKEIKKARKLTSKPFGVNIMLLSPYAMEIVELVQDEMIPVVTTGAGNPSAFVPDMKKKGIRVFPVVASVALARRMEKSGVDGIIAEGTEAGGHVGETGTMALLPQVVDAVSIPVVAAGGIADGRGLVAALALGAEGVQLGTRFVCAQECIVHPRYQEKILQARDRDTVLSGTSTGYPVRAIKNRLTREFSVLEASGAKTEELNQLGAGKYGIAALDGDVDTGSVLAGQISGLIREVKPAAEIIDSIILDAKKEIKGLKKRIMEEAGKWV